MLIDACCTQLIHVNSGCNPPNLYQAAIYIFFVLFGLLLRFIFSRRFVLYCACIGKEGDKIKCDLSIWAVHTGDETVINGWMNRCALTDPCGLFDQHQQAALHQTQASNCRLLNFSSDKFILPRLARLVTFAPVVLSPHKIRWRLAHADRPSPPTATAVLFLLPLL